MQITRPSGLGRSHDSSALRRPGHAITFFRRDGGGGTTVYRAEPAAQPGIGAAPDGRTTPSTTR